MITRAFRGPHSLYRRYQALLEGTATAAGFAALVVLALQDIAVYPENWVLVIGVFVAIVGIRWPLLSYILAVAVMTYPIYTANLYLAVLFIAVSALGHRVFVYYLGATTLVLATPLLAEYHLHWLVPVMGGLWWGGIAGLWIGGLGALWGKLLAGMAGMEIDWLVLAGQVPEFQAIAARFETANSLNTLLLLVEPFAATSTVMLYNLLQVIGWALAGAFVGSLALRKWVRYRTPWSILVVTAGGGLIMLTTHVALPYWLNEAVAVAQLNSSYDPVAPLFSLLVVIIVGTTTYSLRESLDLPVAPKRSLWTARRKKGLGDILKIRPLTWLKRSSSGAAKNTLENSSTTPEPVDDLSRLRRPVRVPNQSELPEWEPPGSDSGLIMLEID